MSTILWLEKESHTRRPTKQVNAVVRYFAPGHYGLTKLAPVDPMTVEWKYADLLGLVKATERFARFTHSLFVVPGNVTRVSNHLDHDGHQILVVTIY